MMKSGTPKELEGGDPLATWPDYFNDEDEYYDNLPYPEDYDEETD